MAVEQGVGAKKNMDEVIAAMEMEEREGAEPAAEDQEAAGAARCILTATSNPCVQQAKTKHSASSA